MATSKTKAAKTQASPKNNPAPKSPENAGVSATGAAQAAPQASTPGSVPGSSVTSENPPQGGTTPALSAQTTTQPDSADLAAAGGAGKLFMPKRLMIAAKADGFRRAGRAWSRSPQTVSFDDFTEPQLIALLGEPMLDVVVVAE